MERSPYVGETEEGDALDGNASSHPAGGAAAATAAAALDGNAMDSDAENDDDTDWVCRRTTGQAASGSNKSQSDPEVSKDPTKPFNKDADKNYAVKCNGRFGSSVKHLTSDTTPWRHLESLPCVSHKNERIFVGDLVWLDLGKDGRAPVKVCEIRQDGNDLQIFLRIHWYCSKAQVPDWESMKEWPTGKNGEEMYMPSSWKDAVAFKWVLGKVKKHEERLLVKGLVLEEQEQRIYEADHKKVAWVKKVLDVRIVSYLLGLGFLIDVASTRGGNSKSFDPQDLGSK